MSNQAFVQENVTDMLIIGGGPTGLFAAFYCGMRNCTCKIIDSLPELGGQLATLYPEKFIYDVAGFPKIRARQLVDQLIEQAMERNPGIHLNESVQTLVRREDGLFELHTDKSVHIGRAVIICAGIGAFSPRPLPAPTAKDFEGRGVAYYIDKVENYRGKNVLVIGGGDSAVDYALMLEEVAASVTLIHRRDQFRAHEESVRQLYESRIQIKTFYELSDVQGGNWVERAVIVNNQTKQTETIEVDAIVSGLGFTASLGPIKEWGLEIEKNDIVVNSKMETNIPGVYAAGDVVTYPGKLKLIATGFGEAPTAVNNAKTFIDPQAKLFPGHSTSMSR
ncbi:FAD-dependent pyridine nucleotide-disulfide oxidoreductase [Alicyclobacillus hesperidum URH17-3-68]|uniref:Ferredoxin--NADP reductase n=2 Tax=Alicyclobacillus hesperidum TaxID=89784 RepID=A0A1H2T5Z0_9BACL|nr:FAD-dependent pyridine nucleotide-disulfide oxidoreductase [Alicyclobacillus hesperidum URH17-3-68]GLV13752.1 ferredoxin--NADP reductase [Alicyclobacillus hesperidum]SDW38664.1 thioredoxin reductase (NADPH) [Alicyclobacillus hesperidum]